MFSLQNEGTALKAKPSMGDEEAEILANSLKHNKKLKYLYLKGNNMTEKGFVAFLKVLVDISSIENTCISNNTLQSCELAVQSSPLYELQTLINGACMDNQAVDMGRAKVIRSHLNSRRLKKLCHLQDIEYIPGNIFSDIEPVLLPKILALIGEKHGQREFYTALIHTAPDLLSHIDQKVMLKDTLAKNTARALAFSNECARQVAEYERKIAALKANLLTETSRLTAHNVDINNRLELIELGDKKQSLEEGGCEEEIGSSKKRQRR